MTENRSESQETTKQPGDEGRLAGVENQRLQSLVGELLTTNQELRFEVARLATELEKSERGLSRAAQWTGMVF
jgi:hypothetical protein